MYESKAVVKNYNIFNGISSLVSYYPIKRLYYSRVLELYVTHKVEVSRHTPLAEAK